MINILMSTYNGAKYITQQLDSIFTQQYSDYKLYVRDDGSSDETLNILYEYQKQLNEPDKMVICKGENIGFCKSFFQLLSMSNEGEYWAFCDQDDVWYDNKLGRAAKWLQQQDDTIPLLYHSGIMFADKDLNPKGVYRIKNYNYDFQKALTSNVFYGFSMVINSQMRNCLLQCDSNEILYHDWFAAIIATGFGKYYFSDEVDSVHRIHETNTSPTSIIKKLPLIKKLFTDDLFYTRNAIEFKKHFYDNLNIDEQELLDLFDVRVNKWKKAITKAFYYKRWNPRLLEEIGMRFFMLLGKI